MLIKPVRIGNNPEIRFTPKGDAVLNLACAYNYGRKDKDTGKQPTQWIDATIWGSRAESLAPYLVKGGQVVLYCDDVHIEEYQKDGATKSKLVGRVVDIVLIGGKSESQPAKQPAKQQKQDDSFFDDDQSIPF